MADVLLRQKYAYSQEKTREWSVPAGTQAHTAVVSASSEPGVTITARGDSTVTTALQGPVTSITVKNGGRSNLPGSATVATDGSYVGAVTGASGTTPKNTLVYAIVSTGAVTGLTLTASGNVEFGVVDDNLGDATASACSVKIGVFA